MKKSELAVGNIYVSNNGKDKVELIHVSTNHLGVTLKPITGCESAIKYTTEDANQVKYCKKGHFGLSLKCFLDCFKLHKNLTRLESLLPIGIEESMINDIEFITDSLLEDGFIKSDILEHLTKTLETTIYKNVKQL